MRNKILMIAAILFCYAKANASGVQDNLVCFNYGSLHNDTLIIESFSAYHPIQHANWYSISDNQQFDGINIHYASKSSVSNCLNVRASRKRSSLPVDFVKAAINWDPLNMVGAQYTAGAIVVPTALNFAFGLNLTFEMEKTTYTCSGLMLAQGSNGAGINDWWIFSNNDNKNKSITCLNHNSGQQVSLYPLGNNLFDNHSFGFYTSPPTK